MNENTLHDINPDMNTGAMSLYGSGGTEEFPVLKAFQQYIDAEQAKARKRLVSMAVFFGVFTLAVIAVFVTLLLYANQRNQTLNDRMLEIVIKERDRQPVVQPQVPVQDNTAVLAMTSKLEELQRNVLENQHKAEKAELERKAAADLAKLQMEAEIAKAKAEADQVKTRMQAELEKARSEAQQSKARAEAELEKVKAEAKREIAAKSEPAVQSPSSQELEIKKLQALLQLEKQKAANAEARRKEADIELYRRKQYPELYQHETQPLLIPAVPIESEPSAATPAVKAKPAKTAVKAPSSKATPSAKAPAKVKTELPVTIRAEDIDSMEPLISYPASKPNEAKPATKKEETKTPTTIKVKGSELDWGIPQR